MNIIPELRQDLVAAASRTVGPEPAAESSRRRSRRLFGLPLVLVATVGVAGAATATGLVVSQATKEQSQALTKAPELTAERPGPAASVGADLEQATKDAKQRIPYPPGSSDSFNSKGHTRGATLGSGEETARETGFVVEYRAACLWRTYFVQSVESGNTRAQADALAILKQVPSWPATRSLASEVAMQKKFAAAAESGDVDALRQDIAINCKNID